MKISFSLLLIFLVFMTQIQAQDLIIAENNDSIPCKITKIDADSAVYFRTGREYKPYNGYLKKDYYSNIIKDHYSDLRRSMNPNSSLLFFSCGAYFTRIPANPVVEKVIPDERMAKVLSDGLSWSLSIQKFKNPLNSNGRLSGPRGNLSYGFTYEGFVRNANSRYLENRGDPEFDMQKRMDAFNLLVAWNTKFRYTTCIALKSGFMISRCLGEYDMTPLKSRSTSLILGLGLHQKFEDIGDHFALFLNIDPYMIIPRKGKMDYLDLDYFTVIYYDEVEIDYGISLGVSLRYFN